MATGTSLSRAYFGVINKNFFFRCQNKKTKRKFFMENLEDTCKIYQFMQQLYVIVMHTVKLLHIFFCNSSHCMYTGDYSILNYSQNRIHTLSNCQRECKRFRVMRGSNYKN